MLDPCGIIPTLTQDARLGSPDYGREALDRPDQWGVNRQVKPASDHLGLAVVDARPTTSRRPSGDTGITHRRQGAADDSLCGRDEAVHPRNLEALAEFQTNGANNYRQQPNT